ncbi:SDR family NAD(P)-dependent oxidoreductase [Streptomyces triticisoli]|jgi:3-oxoacyl-[acyl-carrier protein] reductase|uniref:SDR family NAD(P)-dependent oxidoreductase n=1 Tax=Streptomyces triticisoli TaxID=2182797 RepID=UPI000DD71255|nr:SDR family NAD(P)-dependent oxidoreductase [Streptomyces triticisoli]
MPDQSHVAIVTGAPQGIGATVAEHLVRDGHRVAALDLDATACKPAVGAGVTPGGSAVAPGTDGDDETAVATAVSFSVKDEASRTTSQTLHAAGGPRC